MSILVTVTDSRAKRVPGGNGCGHPTPLLGRTPPHTEPTSERHPPFMRTTLVRRWNWSARRPENDLPAPPRGQRMAGTRQKIAASHRRQGPRINGAGRPNGRQHGLFILRHQNQVFRSKCIHQVHSLLNRGDQKTVRVLVQHLADDSAPAQQGRPGVPLPPPPVPAALPR